MLDLDVKIEYRNSGLQVVAERMYTLPDYAEMLKSDLQRLITDVEDLCYEANDNKPKEEWTDESWATFCKIKHKLLDKAGEIGRLPLHLKEHNDASPVEP